MTDARTINELLVAALYSTCLIIFVSPIYIYGIFKWYQFQRHFIVSKRFPLITNIIVTNSVCGMILVLIRRWIYYFHPEFESTENILWLCFRQMGQGLAYFNNMLVVDRVLLAYLRWKNVQYDVQQMIAKQTQQSDPMPESPESTMVTSIDIIKPNTISTTMSKQISTESINIQLEKTITNSRDQAFSISEFEPEMGEDKVQFIEAHNKNVYRHYTSVIIMILTIIGFLYIILYKTIFAGNTSGLGQMIWAVPLIAGFIVIVLVKCKHVTEGIGLLTEAYLLLAFIVITLMSTPILSGTHIFTIMLSTYPMIPGLLTLYITLYYIYKCEGSLNISKWKKKYKTQMFNQPVIQENKSDFAIVLTDETSTGTKDSGDDNTKSNNSPNQRNRRKDVARMPLSCLTYLEDSENHKIFAEYLAYCWALENILFMEKVSILYQIVLDLKEKNGESRHRTLSLSPNGYSSNNNSINRDRQRTPTSSSPKLQRNKFEHSVQVYFEYHKKIDRFNEKYRASGEMRGNLGTVVYYKKILYKLYRDIYKEFVKTGSKHEINISADIRSELSFLFDDNRNINKFESFDDFLNIFDNALIQVYEMLFSVYNYQFKQYLQDQNVTE